VSMKAQMWDDDKYGARPRYVEEPYNCTDYDDDEFYTPDICSNFDYSTCFSTISEVEGCTSSFWCNKLCGDMCNDGAGAICFFEKISDMKDTCVMVANLRATQNVSYNPYAPGNRSAAWSTLHGYFYDDEGALLDVDDMGRPIYVDDIAEDTDSEETTSSHSSCGKGCSTEAMAQSSDSIQGSSALARLQLSPDQQAQLDADVRTMQAAEGIEVSDTKPRGEEQDIEEIGVGLDFNIADEGCGRHSYCNQCKSYCREKKMKQYLSQNFRCSGGYCPQALKQALENIIETCAHWGFYV